MTATRPQVLPLPIGHRQWTSEELQKDLEGPYTIAFLARLVLSSLAYIPYFLEALQMALRRQNIALKRNDGEPLTRADLQYDVLVYIFSDKNQVFSDPTASYRKVSFRDLYVNSIIHSPKSSKATKEKMVELPHFATDLAMLCLLSNMGRINTTMSCTYLVFQWHSSFVHAQTSLR